MLNGHILLFLVDTFGWVTTIGASAIGIVLLTADLFFLGAVKVRTPQSKSALMFSSSTVLGLIEKHWISVDSQPAVLRSPLMRTTCLQL